MAERIPARTHLKHKHKIKASLPLEKSSAFFEYFKPRFRDYEAPLDGIAKRYEKLITNARPGNDYVEQKKLYEQLYDNLDRQEKVVKKCDELITLVKLDSRYIVFPVGTVEMIERWKVQTTEMTPAQFAQYDEIDYKTSRIYPELIKTFYKSPLRVQTALQDQLKDPKLYSSCLHELRQVLELKSMIDMNMHNCSERDKRLFGRRIQNAKRLTDFLKIQNDMDKAIKEEELSVARRQVRTDFGGTTIPTVLAEELNAAQTIEAIKKIGEKLTYITTLGNEIGRKQGNLTEFNLPPLNPEMLSLELEKHIKLLDQCLVLQSLITMYTKMKDDNICLMDAGVDIAIETGKQCGDLPGNIKIVKDYLERSDQEYKRHGSDRAKLLEDTQKAIDTFSDKVVKEIFNGSLLCDDLVATYKHIQSIAYTNFKEAQKLYTDNSVLFGLVAQARLRYLILPTRSDYILWLKENLLAMSTKEEYIQVLKEFMKYSANYNTSAPMEVDDAIVGDASGMVKSATEMEKMLKKAQQDQETKMKEAVKAAKAEDSAALTKANAEIKELKALNARAGKRLEDKDVELAGISAAETSLHTRLSEEETLLQQLKNDKEKALAHLQAVQDAHKTLSNALTDCETEVDKIKARETQIKRAKSLWDSIHADAENFVTNNGSDSTQKRNKNVKPKTSEQLKKEAIKIEKETVALRKKQNEDARLLKELRDKSADGAAASDESITDDVTSDAASAVIADKLVKPTSEEDEDDEDEEDEEDEDEDEEDEEDDDDDMDTDEEWDGELSLAKEITSLDETVDIATAKSIQLMSRFDPNAFKVKSAEAKKTYISHLRSENYLLSLGVSQEKADKIMSSLDNPTFELFHKKCVKFEKTDGYGKKTFDADSLIDLLTSIVEASGLPPDLVSYLLLRSKFDSTKYMKQNLEEKSHYILEIMNKDQHFRQGTEPIAPVTLSGPSDEVTAKGGGATALPNSSASADTSDMDDARQTLTRLLRNNPVADETDVITVYWELYKSSSLRDIADEKKILEAATRVIRNVPKNSQKQIIIQLSEKNWGNEKMSLDDYLTSIIDEQEKKPIKINGGYAGSSALRVSDIADESPDAPILDASIDTDKVTDELKKQYMDSLSIDADKQDDYLQRFMLADGENRDQFRTFMTLMLNNDKLSHEDANLLIHSSDFSTLLADEKSKTEGQDIPTLITEYVQYWHKATYMKSLFPDISEELLSTETHKNETVEEFKHRIRHKPSAADAASERSDDGSTVKVDSGATGSKHQKRTTPKLDSYFSLVKGVNARTTKDKKFRNFKTLVASRYRNKQSQMPNDDQLHSILGNLIQHGKLTTFTELPQNDQKAFIRNFQTFNNIVSKLYGTDVMRKPTDTQLPLIRNVLIQQDSLHTFQTLSIEERKKLIVRALDSISRNWQSVEDVVLLAGIDVSRVKSHTSFKASKKGDLRYDNKYEETTTKDEAYKVFLETINTAYTQFDQNRNMDLYVQQLLSLHANTYAATYPDTEPPLTFKYVFAYNLADYNLYNIEEKSLYVQTFTISKMMDYLQTRHVFADDDCFLAARQIYWLQKNGVSTEYELPEEFITLYESKGDMSTWVPSEYDKDFILKYKFDEILRKHFRTQEPDPELGHDPDINSSSGGKRSRIGDSGRESVALNFDEFHPANGSVLQQEELIEEMGRGRTPLAGL